MSKWIIFSTFVLLGSCSKSNEKNLGPTTDHIKYFGFTLIDTYWDDPSDAQTKTNYSDEVAPFSNIADILVVNSTDTIVPRMEAMQQLQMKSILHLHELFFELENSDAPSGTNYKLRTDAQTRWDTFMAANSLDANQSKVQALYVGEEPTWNGITFTELKQATDYIKHTLPGVPIMIIEAHPILDKLEIPASVDWIGFDHYFIKDPKNDSAFMAELRLLKSKLTTNQKLVLIMDTHYIAAAHKDFGGIALNEMGIVANSYYDLAKTETKTIAILGYFWPSGFDHPESIGARNMPEVVKAEYRRIGKEITAK